MGMNVGFTPQGEPVFFEIFLINLKKLREYIKSRRVRGVKKKQIDSIFDYLDKCSKLKRKKAGDRSNVPRLLSTHPM